MDAYIPHTHTHTPHNPAALMVHLQRQYNPTGFPVRSQGCTYNPTGHPVLSQAQSGIHPQSHWSPCAFTGMYLQPHWAPCSQAQSGIHPQSHWSPCAFTGIHLHSHGDPCAFTGNSSLKTPSQTPLEPILISVSQSALQFVCLLHLFVLFILSLADFVTYPHGPCPLTHS